MLLGNGFSIALFPDRFRYGSLLDQADFAGIAEARRVFDALETTDFEAVIHGLRQSSILARVYEVEPALIARMEDHADAVKELLVQAIAGRHPERPSDVFEDQYRSCRRFLAHFGGEGRDRLKGNLYSLNYDLLLYWALLHEQVINWNAEQLEDMLEPTEPIAHDDGFRLPDGDNNAEYVTWDGEANHTQCVYYLHGALHLYDYGFELQKKCWERSGGIPLIEQTRAALGDGRFPLYVSEGSSRGKMERIRHSAYLHKALRSFAEICRTMRASLFVFGHSLADNDAHILRQIERGKIREVYISLFGDPASDLNRAVIRRAERMQMVRGERYPLEVHFFDASSARVWTGEA